VVKVNVRKSKAIAVETEAMEISRPALSLYPRYYTISPLMTQSTIMIVGLLALNWSMVTTLIGSEQSFSVLFSDLLLRFSPKTQNSVSAKNDNG